MIGKPKHLTGIGAKAASDVANYVESRAENAGASSAGGYYENQAAPSFWIGAGAEALGLTGEVKREDLIEVLQGHLPTGEDISTRGNRQADRRMATDLTVSPPKSFSMLACAGSDPRLKDLAREAVEVAAKILQDEVIVARRGKGGTEVEHTGSLVAAVFQHEDARQVEGMADMELHHHILIMNATQRSDGTWCARDLDFGERNVTRLIMDYAVKAHLAKRLPELGYKIRRTQDGFEIEGISDRDISLFSRRKEQVDAALEARGLTREDSTAAQREAANLATRGTKTTLSESAQRWEWRSRLREAGIDLDRLTKDAQVRGNIAVADLSADAVKSGTRHLGERETVFSRNDLRLESLKAGMGNTDLSGVEKAIDTKAGGLLDAGGGEFTTRDALFREQDILARARAGAGKVEALMTESEADAYISQREASQGFRYSDGQRQALALSLTSSDSVTGIVGAAGTGKTTSMEALVSAAREQGFEVIGIAPSARARDQLSGAGADVNRTTASFLVRDLDYNENRLVILDEAGMVSARDMDAIMQKIEKEGGRLLLVGDPRQLKAVEAGSPFQQLLETDAIRHARIDQVQRQKDPQLKTLAQAWASGDAVRAVKLAEPYMTEVQVESADGKKPTKPERQAAIAKETARQFLALSPEERAAGFILSPTHAVCSQVNVRIREGLKECGEIGKDEVRAAAIDKVKFTREQAARVEFYQAGMVVRLEEGRGKARTTIDYIVARTQGNRVILRGDGGNEKSWNPAREKAAGVYAAREMTLAAGDQIVFRDIEKAGGEKIENGRGATVERIEHARDGSPQIAVRLDDGQEITLDPKQNHSIDYGWCRTIHSSQGADKDAVFLAAEGGSVAAAELAHVGMTRARKTLVIVTDNKSKLAEGWVKWSDQKHARDVARNAADPRPDRLHDLRAESAAELGRAGDLAEARESQADRKPEPEPAATPDRKRDRGRERELER